MVRRKRLETCVNVVLLFVFFIIPTVCVGNVYYESYREYEDVYESHEDLVREYNDVVTTIRGKSSYTEDEAKSIIGLVDSIEESDLDVLVRDAYAVYYMKGLLSGESSAMDVSVSNEEEVVRIVESDSILLADTYWESAEYNRVVSEFRLLLVSIYVLGALASIGIHVLLDRRAGLRVSDRE